MIKFFYQCALVFFLVINIPRALGMFLFGKKYQRSWLYRLGLKKQNIKPCDLWVHGVSLGEVKEGLLFIQSFKSLYPQKTIAFSCSTEAGMQEALKFSSLLDSLFYLPLDCSFLIKPLVKKIAPKVTVLVEGDLWPNFLQYVKKEGSKIAVINAKISNRSFARYKRAVSFAKWVFSHIDFLCVQNKEYAVLFEHLSSCPYAITGNMKFDLCSAKTAALQQTASGNVWTLLIVSTHEKEEELLINVLNPLTVHLPQLRIFLAPRHPYRFEKVRKLFEKKGLDYKAISFNSTKETAWTLIDKMGVLNHYYPRCDAAIVGGSFVKVGGHNILEPLSFGKMTFFGPFMHAQKELVDLALKEKIAIQTTLHALPQELNCFINSKQRPQTKEFFEKYQGATQRNLEALKNLFQF